jgi:hypothetical protein
MDMKECVVFVPRPFFFFVYVMRWEARAGCPRKTSEQTCLLCCFPLHCCTTALCGCGVKSFRMPFFFLTHRLFFSVKLFSFFTRKQPPTYVNNDSRQKIKRENSHKHGHAFLFSPFFVCAFVSLVLCTLNRIEKCSCDAKQKRRCQEKKSPFSFLLFHRVNFVFFSYFVVAGFCFLCLLL